MLKKESQQNNLKNMVKKLGWDPMAKAVGGTTNLIKLGFNNNPIEFLDLFNDLEMVTDSNIPGYAYFRDNDLKNLMLFETKRNFLYLDYSRIYEPLVEFDWSIRDYKQIVGEWFKKNYNLEFKDCSTRIFQN